MSGYLLAFTMAQIVLQPASVGYGEQQLQLGVELRHDDVGAELGHYRHRHES